MDPMPHHALSSVPNINYSLYQPDKKKGNLVLTTNNVNHAADLSLDNLTITVKSERLNATRQGNCQCRCRSF